MKRFHLAIFVASLVALSWLAMMAFHEMGHVLGATLTGGTVQRVNLHPLTISRTDVSPNLHPGIVVWSGPIVGCLLPLVLSAMVPRRYFIASSMARFFAGFCLIANGAYISVGSLDRIGDCGEMLRTGTPVWTMWVFGIAAILQGLYVWHRLGSLKQLIGRPSAVTAPMAYATFGTLVIVTVALTVC